MPLVSTDRITVTPATSAIDGNIVFDPVKAGWIGGMIIGGIVALLLFPGWSELGVFLALSSLTLCAGHSVGMHRLLIHRSFETPIWVEHILVYLGVLVGMAGPFGMIRAHDMRDWHQRQTICPAHPSHGAHFLTDAYWQLCCRFDLDNPPEFNIEPAVKSDRFYRFLEATWMWQQIPLALLLYSIGGVGWVLWGICLRVTVSLIGHWAVGHIAHHRGQQGWIVTGLPVQGYNLPRLAFITFGESLHGNHHAFPHSAKLGIEPGQSDLGFTFITALHRLGLAKRIKTPQSAPARQGLRRIAPAQEQG